MPLLLVSGVAQYVSDAQPPGTCSAMPGARECQELYAEPAVKQSWCVSLWRVSLASVGSLGFPYSEAAVRRVPPVTASII